MFDYIVVGVGFAGAVIAERIANVLNKEVLVIEKRNHIGGNCFDYYDENGILIHKYGPHIFHTELEHVWKYLSKFTEWHKYEHNVLGVINGKNIPIPFNLNSLYKSFSFNDAKRIESKLVQNYGFGAQVPILELKKSRDEDLQLLADYVYRNVFLNYSQKQWGFKPEELDSSVTARVPVLISRDNRYFQDPFQGLPQEGYAKLFERMLSNNLIKIKLNMDYKEILKFENGVLNLFGEKFQGKLIFTGEIDTFFDHKFGKLPYRSLHFKMEKFDQEFFQEVGVVNYPNEYAFTRITEFKHMTGQIHEKTIISKEYPHNYNSERDIPYYPIPINESKEIYEKYKKEASKFDNLIFVGRLADYKYLNMDKAIDRALTIFKERIIDEK